VVRGIIMPEQAARGMLAPGELRAAHESVEEALIERLENLVQIVMKPLRGGNSLAASHLANALALANDGFAGGEAAVAVGVGGINGLAIELGEQDMRDGAEDRLGRAFEDVRKMDLEASVPQPDGG